MKKQKKFIFIFKKQSGKLFILGGKPFKTDSNTPSEASESRFGIFPTFFCQITQSGHVLKFYSFATSKETNCFDNKMWINKISEKIEN